MQQARRYRRAVIFILLCAAQQVVSEPAVCTYTTYTWNAFERRALHPEAVKKPYLMLDEREVDPITGCTVCEEDQLEIAVAGIAPFKVCKHIYAAVTDAIEQSLAHGFPINSVTGYRVGLTRGPADGVGNRTRFSNHSYGIAIDINTESNGLYDNCMRFGPGCRLIKGGPWDQQDPASIMPDSTIVGIFYQAGFKWGGEIDGRQKDFMHFSPSGY